MFLREDAAEGVVRGIFFDDCLEIWIECLTTGAVIKILISSYCAASIYGEARHSFAGKGVELVSGGETLL